MARIKYYNTTTQQWEYADIAIQSSLPNGTALGDTLIWDGSKWKNKPAIPSKLPPLYQEVEFIQSTGTQYIQLNFPFSGSSKAVIDFGDSVLPEAYENIVFSAGIFSARIALSEGICGIFVTYPNSYDFINILNSSTDRILFNLDKNYLYIGNNLAHTFDATNAQSIDDVALFGADLTAETRHVATKLYSAKFFTDGELISDLVPCFRIADGVIGLYDVVQNEFFENDGSGEFIAGTPLLDGVPDEQLILTCANLSDFVTIGGNYVGIDSNTAIAF